MDLKAGLYIVSTPIGNLEDITLRAISVLTNCDIIYCEDTRFTNKLLQKHHIYGKKLAVYNDHSSPKTREIIAEQLRAGSKIALVSDAGTPLIADPGYKLIRFLHEEKLRVDVIPGACSAISALVLSGLATDQFYFAGFIPKTRIGRSKFFGELKSIPATLIFYDTAIRLTDSLKIALEVFGNREAAVVREITKLYQTIYYQHIEELLENLSNTPVKGEIVLLISGKVASTEINLNTIIAELNELRAKGLSNKDAIAIILTSYPKVITKKELYRLIHK